MGVDEHRRMEGGSCTDCAEFYRTLRGRIHQKASYKVKEGILSWEHCKTAENREHWPQNSWELEKLQGTAGNREHCSAYQNPSIIIDVTI